VQICFLFSRLEAIVVDTIYDALLVVVVCHGCHQSSTTDGSTVTTQKKKSPEKCIVKKALAFSLGVRFGPVIRE